MQIGHRWRLSSEYTTRYVGIYVDVTVSLNSECLLMVANKFRLFSDEGRSFSFDSRGTGYGRGEGCGMVVLKPLDQALKDNDTIRAVIAGTGINQDGKTPGITMPSGLAQGKIV
jgi:acyl transferase domain-containing protein